MKFEFGIIAGTIIIMCVSGCSRGGSSTTITNQPDTQPTQPAPGFDLYADLYNGLGTTQHIRLTGRLVHESQVVDITSATPNEQISQDEAKNTAFSLWLANVRVGSATTNDEGYFDHLADIAALNLQPGIHVAQLRVDGVVAGVCEVTLLAPDHAGLVVRSDVDLTYLNTDFQSLSGLAGLMTANASKRETLPGMTAIYQALDRPTVFLSGSPLFFKRILEGKMQLDGVSQAGLVLKPYKALVLFGLFDPSSIMPSLKEQVGYKLTRLLELRRDLPATTGEILMGDDSEADHVVYQLYHRFTSGQLSQDALMAELADLDVVEPWLGAIQTAGPAALQALDGNVAVKAIYINATEVPAAHFPIEDWIVEGLTVHHAGAGPLAADLEARGYISAEAARAVR